MQKARGRIDRRTFIKGVSAALASGCAGVGAPSTGPSEVEMSYRVLGRTGLKVSVLACGAVEEHVLNAALDAGINYIDTAPCYPAGHNEDTVGNVLRRRKAARDKLIIATKINKRHFARIRPSPPKTYIESVEQSLQRLGIDHIDILVQHEAEFEDMSDEDVLDAFHKLKKAGKVRFLGAATHSHQGSFAIEAALQSDDYDMFMLTYNPFDVAKDLEGVLTEAKQKNIGLIAMKTVMLLKGAIHREQNPEFIAEMKRRAKEQGRGLNVYQTSIAWALGHNAISAACITFGNVQELKEDVAASGVRFSALDRKEFRQYAGILSGAICDWCGRCLPTCPNGIAIPDIARFTLYYDIAHDPARAREEYACLHPRQRVSNCIGCGNCERSCPKRLPIRAMLREAEAVLA